MFVANIHVTKHISYFVFVAVVTLVVVLVFFTESDASGITSFVVTEVFDVVALSFNETFVSLKEEDNKDDDRLLLSVTFFRSVVGCCDKYSALIDLEN